MNRDTLAVLSLLAGVLGGTATGCTFLWRMLIQPMRRHMDRQEMFWADWQGRPARPGVRRQPGVMERLGDLEKRLADVEQRLSNPDSGLGKLRDLMTTMEGRLAAVERECRPGGGVSLDKREDGAG